MPRPAKIKGVRMANSKSTRRDVLAGGAAAAGLSWGGAQALEPALRPNIIFIMADDMGVADASCYGAPRIKTPAIDQIAAKGVRVTQAYANSAV